MLNLDFYYLSARNFRCFGPQRFELDLRSFDSIVLVKGENLDRQGKLDINSDSESKSRNGVGKSSIPEIIIYALYGKALKASRSQDRVINKKTGKDLEVEVRWGSYRVVRTRSPDTLRLWESNDLIWDKNTEITKTGPATQKKIEELIGMSRETFVNTIVFTDKSKDAFLECTTPGKREIIENLLSLGEYADYHESAKKMRREYQATIDTAAVVYERLLSDLEASKNRVNQVKLQEINWKNNKKKELIEIVNSIKEKQKLLSSTDDGAALVEYDAAQDKIKTINESISPTQHNIEKINSIVADVNSKLDQNRSNKNDVAKKITVLEQEIQSKEFDISKDKKTIDVFAGKDGTQCPSCLGVVSEENYADVVKHAETKKEKAEKQISELIPKLATLKEEQTQLVKDGLTYQKTIKMAEQKSSELNQKLVNSRNEISKLAKIAKPQVGTTQRLLEDQIEQLKKQGGAKKSEYENDSPYVEIIDSAVKDVEEKSTVVNDKKAELAVIEQRMPYYEFWVKAFSDVGIRKFVIDGIMPALNSRISYWLQFLIESKIRLTFDNELNETIENEPSDGEPFIYSDMSGGEQQRLNLSVSQAFAYVMMLNSGVSPSCVFLDEVTKNIDPLGVEGVYKMILELSKTKRVFVTTHDQDLLNLMQGCQSIHLVRKDGFTTLRNG